jgi:hypothetical protein
MKKPLLTTMTATCLFLSTSAQASSPSGFKTPSGNIACEVYEGILRCDLRENSAAIEKIPKAPKDCDLDWGNMFTLDPKGKGKRLCAGDTVFGEQKVLAYGKTWKYKGFVCQSATTGLTCTNRNKHGWMLNKIVQRLF